MRTSDTPKETTTEIQMDGRKRDAPQETNEEEKKESSSERVGKCNPAAREATEAKRTRPERLLLRTPRGHHAANLLRSSFPLFTTVEGDGEEAHTSLRPLKQVGELPSITCIRPTGRVTYYFRPRMIRRPVYTTGQPSNPVGRMLLFKTTRPTAGS